MELLVVGVGCVAFGLLPRKFVGGFVVANLDGVSEETFAVVVAVEFAFAVGFVQ